MDGYEKSVRPVYNSSAVLTIRFGLHLNQIVGLVSLRDRETERERHTQRQRQTETQRERERWKREREREREIES